MTKVHKLQSNVVSIQGQGGDVIEGPGYQGGYGPPGPPRTVSSFVDLITHL